MENGDAALTDSVSAAQITEQIASSGSTVAGAAAAAHVAQPVPKDSSAAAAWAAQPARKKSSKPAAQAALSLPKTSSAAAAHGTMLAAKQARWAAGAAPADAVTPAAASKRLRFTVRCTS